MYDDPLVDHFVNPRNVGTLEDPDGYAQEGSIECGDMMEMFIMVEGDTITDVKYRTFGCASAIASSSMASELIKGHSIAVAEAITKDTIADALGGLSPAKMHCSLMAVDALRGALADFRKKQAQPEGEG